VIVACMLMQALEAAGPVVEALIALIVCTVPSASVEARHLWCVTFPLHYGGVQLSLL
jgi:hypothetical protein